MFAIRPSTQPATPASAPAPAPAPTPTPADVSAAPPAYRRSSAVSTAASTVTSTTPRSPPPPKPALTRRTSLEEDYFYREVMTVTRRPNEPPPSYETTLKKIRRREREAAAEAQVAAAAEAAAAQPMQAFAVGGGGGDGKGKAAAEGPGLATLRLSMSGTGGGGGGDVLPAYSCDLHMEGVFQRKMELENAPTKRAEDRRWSAAYVVLHGTALEVYRCRKDRSRRGLAARGGPGVSPDRPPWMRPAGLEKRYNLTYADVGIAADYLKRKYVIRVRAETDQFLLACIELETFVGWLDAFFAALSIAAPIDERDFPRDQSIPRIQRIRWFHGRATAVEAVVDAERDADRAREAAADAAAEAAAADAIAAAVHAAAAAAATAPDDGGQHQRSLTPPPPPAGAQVSASPSPSSSSPSPSRRTVTIAPVVSSAASVSSSASSASTTAAGPSSAAPAADLSRAVSSTSVQSHSQKSQSGRSTASGRRRYALRTVTSAVAARLGGSTGSAGSADASAPTVAQPSVPPRRDPNNNSSYSYNFHRNYDYMVAAAAAAAAEGVDAATGKWQPRHRWTSTHDMVYAKLCYATLLFRSPRKSNYVIMRGKQWFVDWATGNMMRVSPPRYGEFETSPTGPFQILRTENPRL